MKNVFMFLVLLMSECIRISDSELGNNYFVLSESKQRTFICKRSEKNSAISDYVIMPYVKSFVFDEKYILVHRILTTEVRNFYLDANDDLWNKQNGPDNQYWIIDKDKDITYGPLSPIKLNFLKDSLKINLDLKIE